MSSRLTGRRDASVEAMDNSYRLLDLTVYGRQETWEDSPTSWLQRFKGEQVTRTHGRPTAQWSRLKALYSDDLGDLVPKSRDEKGFKFPMEWVRRHDQH